MAKVQPIEIPHVGIGTTLEVTVLNFKTSDVTAQTWNRLVSDEGMDVIPAWNYSLTEAEYAAWGEDNSVVDDYVAAAKGLVIIPDVPVEGE
jgi:hypothetical protein